MMQPLHGNPAYIKAMADAFNKWQQEFKDSPESFTDCEVYEGDYGLACAKKLIEYMKGE